MSAKLKRRLFTVKEYHQMIEIGILSKDDRVELIEGEIIQMAAVGTRHASCVTQLIDICQKLPENRTILDVKNHVQLSQQTELKPDAVLLKFRDNNCERLPPAASEVLLLIEITDSTSDNDRDIKIPIYARSMIPEVWAIDLTENILEVYRQPTPNGYSLILKLDRCQEIAPIAFPDFAVTVDAILPAINK
ncbi:MAG: Uma2 family endonuclease [Microcoleus sp.]